MTENKAQPEKLDLRSQDTGEARFITFGVSTSGRLLVVAHTEHLSGVTKFVTLIPDKRRT